MGRSFAGELLGPGHSEDGEAGLPVGLASRFDIVERLARNDCGETWLLSEKDGGKRFVLKSRSQENAVDEAGLLRGLEHKGLPRFEAESGGRLALREYIEGDPLDAYVGGRPLSEAQAVRIAAELCDILSFLHSQPVPIIHRDVKPSNIIVGPDGAVTLIDFGISRKYAESAEADTVCFGTRSFAPPEQYGFAQTDCRADIFALGIVLRFMLTGSIDGTVSGTALARIVARCTAFSPDGRYRSADALNRALARYGDRGAVKAAGAATVVLLLCGAFAVGMAVRRHEGDVFQNETLGYGLAAADEAPVSEDDTDVSDEPPVPEDDMDIPSGSLAPNGESIPAAVTFREPLIERAVRLMLGKDDGEAIYPEELSRVTELYIVGGEAAATAEEYKALCDGYASRGTRPFGSLTDLSDIKMLPEIRRINIVGQPVSDVSPLVGCTRLTWIDMKHCDVKDPSPLAGMAKLEDLVLFENMVEDFSCFSRMKALRQLVVGEMPITGLAELGDIYWLEDLSLHNAPVASLEGIERFTSLKTLIIVGTDVSDFSPLDALPALEAVEISPDMERYLDTLSREDIDVRVWG